MPGHSAFNARRIDNELSRKHVEKIADPVGLDSLRRPLHLAGEPMVFCLLCRSLSLPEGKQPPNGCRNVKYGLQFQL